MLNLLPAKSKTHLNNVTKKDKNSRSNFKDAAKLTKNL